MFAIYIGTPLIRIHAKKSHIMNKAITNKGDSVPKLKLKTLVKDEYKLNSICSNVDRLDEF